MLKSRQSDPKGATIINQQINQSHPGAITSISPNRCIRSYNRPVLSSVNMGSSRQDGGEMPEAAAGAMAPSV